jgi:hypothetical protein
MAQTVERTYAGDPLEEAYRGAANAVFAYLPEYTCALEASTEEGEARSKFLAAKKLDPTTPTITGSCKFSGQKCFSRRGVVMMCFDHGGLMIIERIKFSRKTTKAVAELTYLLADSAGKAAGIGFSKANLEKEPGGWSVQNFEDTGAWDLRTPKASGVVDQQ